jgi:hypothetical protein
MAFAKVLFPDNLPVRRPEWYAKYERRAKTTCWYEAPSVGYTALLEVIPTSFIQRVLAVRLMFSLRSIGQNWRTQVS